MRQSQLTANQVKVWLAWPRLVLEADAGVVEGAVAPAVGDGVPAVAHVDGAALQTHAAGVAVVVVQAVRGAGAGQRAVQEQRAAVLIHRLRHGLLHQRNALLIK